MAHDARTLRDEAAAATAAGKHKRALAAYLELERLEPGDAQWARRAGETYRRLGNTKLAIEALNRSVERYAQNGFLVQAIAVCKLILQIDPNHAGALSRLAQMNEMVGSAPTRASTMAEHNPGLHENPSVAALRRRTSTHASPAPARTKPTTPPTPTVGRTKSKPITLQAGAALESVQLSKEVPDSALRESSTPGIHLIPIHDERSSAPVIMIEEPDTQPYEADVEELSELDLADIEEIPLPAPRAMGQAAARALAQTPLFSGMPGDLLAALVEQIALVPLLPNEFLFREGDPSDALYVVVEGEVSLQAEGPPRVELSRLGSGGFLGEIALISDQPRTVTATALVESELLRIDRATLANVLGHNGEMLHAILRFVRDRVVERWMRTSPLFRPFDERQRSELAARFSFLEIDPGVVLLGAGAKPDGLYIVLAGQFYVRRNGAAVANLGPGDLIGETALLSGGAFRSDVVSRGKSLALCLPADDFREVIMTHPHVLEYIGEQAEHSRRLQIL